MEIKQEINNIENLSSQLNFPYSLNNKENQYFYENIKKYEEEKNDQILSSKNKDNNSINNINKNNINIDKIMKEEQIINIKEESKKITIEKEETLSNDLILDEIKLKVDYDKIENELNILRNNNVEENEIKEDNKKINKIDLNNKDINVNNDNKNNQRTSLYSSSQIEGDLFYYSEEEDEKMKLIKSNNEKIKLIQENINKIEKNKNENENKTINEEKENTSLNSNIIQNDIVNNKPEKDEKIDIDSNINNNIDNNKKTLIEKAEYGIDETGNPLSIKNYNEEITKNDKIKKLIAYIIPSDEKGKNYLVDLKGEIIPKMDDGDFNYKYNNIRIIIKNFDVQNPKLRVFGARQRYSSILYEEENNFPQNEKTEKDEINENNNNRFLFNKIKDNINFENEKINYIVSKYSPITNRNNFFEQKLNDNIKNNKYFNKWMNKYSPITERRRIYLYDKNDKDILIQNFPLKRKNNENIIDISEDNERSNLLQKTSFILNRNANRNLVLNNKKHIEKIKNNSNFKNIFLEKKQIDNNTWRNNRTPSPNLITPIINEYIYQPERVKNNSNTSRINIYKVQRLKKSGIGNFRNYFKLNIENNNNSNQCYSSSEKEVLKNSYSSYFNNTFFKRSNPILITNDKQMVKSSNSSFYKFYNNKNNINNLNKKNNPHPLLKKSLSTNNHQLTMTLNSIANNIKKIENNIKSTLQKLINKNRVLNNNIEKSKDDNEIMSYNEKKNRNYKNLPNFFSYKPYKRNILKYISNNNVNSERKINLRKIPLQKKYKISTSPNRNFQCSVLSNEANNMIKDYTNKSITQRNINENSNKKFNIYNFMKNDENKNKIISLIKKSQNKMNKINISKKQKLNKSYSIDKKNDRKKISIKKIDKNIIYIKDTNKNNILFTNKSFNKLFEKTIKLNSENKKINKKNNNQIVPIQNNLNINFYNQQNKPKIKNSALRILATTVIRKKINKDIHKNKNSSQSTSINSFKEFQ